MPTQTEIINKLIIDECFSLFSPFEELRIEQGLGNEIEWKDVFEKLTISADPPLNQISSIASGNLISALDRIYAAGSRRILRRRRVRKHISKIREIDSRAMMKNMMLPGKNLAEKAGEKQALWCIDRYESFDTAENKIAKKIFMTLRDKTKEYLDEYGKIECNRVKRVRALNNRVKMFLAPDGYFSDSRVKEVKTIGDPNYVLKYDPDYREIWKAHELMKKTFEEKLKSRKEDILFEAVMCYARGFLDSTLTEKYICYDLHYKSINIIKQISESQDFLHSIERLRGLWIKKKDGSEIRFYEDFDSKEIIFKGNSGVKKIKPDWDNDLPKIQIDGNENKGPWRIALCNAMKAVIK